MDKLHKQAVLNLRTGQPITTACGLGMFDPDELILITPVPRTFSDANLPESVSLTHAPQVGALVESGDVHPDLMQTTDTVHVGASGTAFRSLEGTGSGTNIEQSFLPLTDIIPHPGALPEFLESSSTYVD